MFGRSCAVGPKERGEAEGTEETERADTDRQRERERQGKREGKRERRQTYTDTKLKREK